MLHCFGCGRELQRKRDVIRITLKIFSDAEDNAENCSINVLCDDCDSKLCKMINGSLFLDLDKFGSNSYWKEIYKVRWGKPLRFYIP